MPRDDLSIDFVKRMPQGGEALDPALILEDWINRVANLPEEIRFLQDEIADRDRQYNECIRVIEERDGRIQKFIKANGSHENNPREDGYRKAIAENFKKAESLADEKIALSQKMQAIMDRHTRQLDMQIKQLYDRGEPGFTDPDELPSILRPSAANQIAAVSARASASRRASPAAAVSNMLKEATRATGAASSAGSAGSNAPFGSGGGRGASNAQVRQAQAQQGHSASAPASPAASMILGRQAREGSAGPGSGTGKRGPRASNLLANAQPTTSGLARHSSLGPGTSKSHQATTGVQRAGSAGPRGPSKTVGGGPGRKANTPLGSSGTGGGGKDERTSGPGRKKASGTNTPTAKASSLVRGKRPAKSSAASSTAESELSDAESSSDSVVSSRRGTPARGASQASGSGAAAAGPNGNSNGNANGAGDKEGSSQPLVKREKDSVSAERGLGSSAGASSGPGSGTGAGTGGAGGGGGVTAKHRSADGPGGRGHIISKGGAPSSDDRMDVDDEEAGDDRKYCLCQNVSFGDMVACDNDECPYEWFHWSCVGLKSEPNGTWYCPECTEKKGDGAVAGTGHHTSRAGLGGGTGHNDATGSGAGATGGSGPVAATASNGAPVTSKKAK